MQEELSLGQPTVEQTATHAQHTSEARKRKIGNGIERKHAHKEISKKSHLDLVVQRLDSNGSETLDSTPVSVEKKPSLCQGFLMSVWQMCAATKHMPSEHMHGCILAVELYVCNTWARSERLRYPSFPLSTDMKTSLSFWIVFSAMLRRGYYFT
jgi:hypothetical protein